MEKEGKFMATLDATIQEDNGKYFIAIQDGDKVIKIPISEDQPNEVKNAFNKIILRLKRGKFSINIINVQQDLFSQVANEYIKQLNRELLEVFGEMERYSLIETTDSSVAQDEEF